ncbi:MAG TPA: TonB-dependent receptor [Burkholderiaceae bacterium]
MKSKFLTPLACAIGFSLHASAEPTEATEKLAPVVLTGNPLRSMEAAAPVESLAGDALTLQRGSTLGDTLGAIAGVGSSYFGPNSNRPTIRGLDGDRVKMLNNSGASVDVSSLSFDHALPVDPLVIERIEVLRGAAALLYGGSAIGGVVNTLDNRIPRQRLQGITGVAELRLGGAAAERNAAAVLDGGSGDWAWHADAAGRSSDDARVPTQADLPGNVIRNSASDSHAGAVGISRITADGRFGVSLDDYRNVYGVTVEPDVTVRMQRRRLATAGEWRWADGPLRHIQWQASRSLYQHSEIEGDGTVGTTFRSQGNDWRIEAEHTPIGPLRGVIGMQAEQSDFSALGDEALVPSTRTKNAALFLLEQTTVGALDLSAGLRSESVRVRADSIGTSRNFTPLSASVTGSFALSTSIKATASASASQRAPSFYELFAHGVHVASGAFEIGDASLVPERAKGFDFALAWQGKQGFLRANVYSTRFSNYLALEATGATQEDLPVYAYRGVPAVLQGFEIEGRTHFELGGLHAHASFTLDGVRGTDRSTKEPLPRLAPLRAIWALEAEQGPWQGRLELQQVARQTRVPSLDKPTPGYGMARLSVSRQISFGDAVDALWYVKLDNIGNRFAHSASTVATLRDLAPLPGRSVLTGLQLKF